MSDKETGKRSTIEIDVEEALTARVVRRSLQYILALGTPLTIALGILGFRLADAARKVDTTTATTIDRLDALRGRYEDTVRGAQRALAAEVQKARQEVENARNDRDRLRGEIDTYRAGLTTALTDFSRVAVQTGEARVEAESAAKRANDASTSLASYRTQIDHIAATVQTTVDSMRSRVTTVEGQMFDAGTDILRQETPNQPLRGSPLFVSVDDIDDHALKNVRIYADDPVRWLIKSESAVTTDNLIKFAHGPYDYELTVTHILRFAGGVDHAVVYWRRKRTQSHAAR